MVCEIYLFRFHGNFMPHEIFHGHRMFLHGHDFFFHGSWIISIQTLWKIHGLEEDHENENLYFHDHEKWVHGFFTVF